MARLDASRILELCLSVSGVLLPLSLVLSPCVWSSSAVQALPCHLRTPRASLSSTFEREGLEKMERKLRNTLESALPRPNWSRTLQLRGGQRAFDGDQDQVSFLDPSMGFDVDVPLPVLGNLTFRQIEEKGISGLDDVWKAIEEEAARKYGDDAMADEGEGEFEGVEEDEEIDEKMLEGLPVKEREALEAQLKDLDDSENTCLAAKYPEVYYDMVNLSTVEDLPVAETAKISGLAALLQELAANTSDQTGAGVGLQFSCKAPHFTCVITEVKPMLAAWDAGISAGDVIVAIDNQTIKGLVDAVMENVNVSIRESRRQKDDIQLMFDLAKGRDASLFVNESNALVHKTIADTLHGEEGSSVNLTIRKTFRYIERLTKKRSRRHPKYDGHPVIVSHHLPRAEKEDLPPNWVYAVRYAWLDKAGVRQQKTLEELKMAGAISDEEFKAGFDALPDSFKTLATEDNSFKQAFICYYNTVSKCYSLVRPKYDPPFSGPSAERLRRYAVELWDTAAAGQAHKLESLVLRGADPNWRNPDWKLAAPIHKAAEKGHLEALDKLLELGADPFITNQLGWTALHYACFMDHAEVVQRLLAVGLDANAKTSTNWTPLHQCGPRGAYRSMQVLVAHGADKAALCDHGFTPCELVIVLDTLKTHKIDRQRLCLDALAPLPPSTRSRIELERDGLVLV